MFEELFMEVEDEVICQNHQEKVVKIGKDSDVPLSSILWCQKCYSLLQQQQNKGFIMMVNLKELIHQQYDQKNESLKQQKQDIIKNLMQFKNGMQVLLTELNKNINDLIQTIDQFRIEIEQIGKPPMTISLLTEIEKVQKNNFKGENNIEKLNLLQKSHLNVAKQKLTNISTMVIKEFSKCFDNFLNILGRTGDWHKFQQIQMAQPVCLKIKNKNISQPKQCGSFIFKKNNMISGFDDQIKLWQVKDGELKELKVLEGHKSRVYCIAVSQKQNWFATGSMDGSIIIWKEFEEFNWKKQKLQQKEHDSFINSLILNKEENQLISCSTDGFIKIWKVDCIANQISYSYKLYSNQGVLAISLNQSEKYLISCHLERYIFLWPSFDGQFSFEKKRQKKIDIPGTRICFINEKNFVIQENNSKLLSVYTITLFDIELVSNIDLQYACTPQNRSPTFINKKRMILVHQSGRYVHIFKLLKEGALGSKIEIDCEQDDFYCQYEEDDEFLVVWGSQDKSFKIYKIEFDQQAKI